ncbi:MAG: IS30 family transposase, partial [Phycisphaerae bacterium]|nr:IS30 family transposase [Phycisphaerae bacterium]
MGDRHLTIDERESILKMHSEQKNMTDIADEIGRNKGTISRELSRNRSSTGEYKPHLAQRYYTKRRDASNGKEFAGFKALEKAVGFCCYFADPYSSYQRGTNENTNGLLRQFFPKGTDFNKISEEEIDKAAALLNNRPRKCLNYRTPHEVL